MNLLNSKEFEEKLMELINSSGLPVSEAYYIVTNAALQLKIIYNDLLIKEANQPKTTTEIEEIKLQEEEQK